MFQAALRKPVKFKTKAEQEKTQRPAAEALAASRRMAKIRADERRRAFTVGLPAAAAGAKDWLLGAGPSVSPTALRDTAGDLLSSGRDLASQVLSAGATLRHGKGPIADAAQFAVRNPTEAASTVADNIATFLPGVGGVKTFTELTDLAAEARAAGRNEEADIYSSLAVPMAGAVLATDGSGALALKGLAGLGRKRAVEEGADFAVRRPLVSADLPRERVLTVTPEATPGASSGHRADILTGKLSAKKRYGEQASSIRRSPEGLPYDVLYAAQGIPQRPAEEAAGSYINSLGQQERSPVDVIQPFVGAEPSPEMLKRIQATENFRGLNTAQEAMAGNMPVATGTPDAILYEMPTQPSYSQMGRSAQATSAAGGDTGMTATSRGGLLVPFSGGGVPALNADEIPAMLDRLRQVYPNAVISPQRNAGGFFDPALGKWGEHGVVGTKPFSGEATMQTLKTLADAPEDVTQGLSAPEVKDWLRQTILRDSGQPGVREDLQNTRRMFAASAWPKVVELIRKGLSPAAALAAFGYSVDALASPASE